MPLLTFFAHTSTDTHSHLTAAESAAVAGALLAILFSTIVAYTLISFMLGRIFKKAGVDSWKAWVPVYSTWTTLELGGQKGWWAVLFLIPFANLIAMVYLYIAMYTIGLRLGKDGYFVLWAIFLPYVWYAWLAFDKSTWKAPASHAVSHPDQITKE